MQPAFLSTLLPRQFRLRTFQCGLKAGGGESGFPSGRSFLVLENQGPRVEHHEVAAVDDGFEDEHLVLGVGDPNQASFGHDGEVPHGRDD